VQANGDPGGHPIHAPRQARDDRVEGLRAARPEGLLQGAELHRDIPLHRHLIGRDRGQQPAQVGEHGPLVGVQQRLLLLRHDVGADRGHRGRILDLEADAVRDHALLAQRGEDPVRPQVGIGVAEVRPARLGRIRPVGQPEQRHLLVVPFRRTRRPGRHQPGQLREPLELEEDPAAPVPGLPIRDPPQPGGDPRGDLAHHRLGIVQVDAAVEVDMIRWHGTLPAAGSIEPP